MKKKQKSDQDVSAMMAQIQEQLAVLNQKLDSFMTKSLTELAQALAASKPVVRPPVQALPSERPTQNESPPRRPMYAVICYECGKDSELPFKPSGNRPVYCKECFAKRKGRTVTVKVENPTAAAPSAVSAQQPVPVSAPPVKVKKKVAVSKTAKAKKKVSKKPAAQKKPVAREKTTATKKAAVKRK